jgi:DNA-binding NarL/FixJ family response regulator
MTLRLLIADDHAMFRDGLAALLGRTGEFEIAGFAADGREAVRLALAHKPDVVVMDLAMPGMNGLEAVQELRRRAPRIRVLVLSMFATLAHAQRAFAAGASGYVLKEAGAGELREAIRRVHAGRGVLDRRLDEKAAALLMRKPEAGAAGADLSRRERQIVQLVVEGQTSPEIAARLHLSTKTVETYRSRAMQKLGLDGVASLVKFALSHGLTPP